VNVKGRRDRGKLRKRMCEMNRATQEDKLQVIIEDLLTRQMMLVRHAHSYFSHLGEGAEI
jgi:hypothetical protein